MSIIHLHNQHNNKSKLALMISSMESFRLENNRSNVLANRRDVINKAILRAFKKFFVVLLSSARLKAYSSAAKSKLAAKTVLVKTTNQLGILSLRPDSASETEFGDFVCWLGFAKVTKAVKSLFGCDNSSINTMEDILMNYSHHKLSEILKNEQVRVLMSYFISHGKQAFINSLLSNHNSNNRQGLNVSA